MATIHPYLSFAGNCMEAFEFYKSVFGGEFPYVGRYKDMPSDSPLPEELLEKIMHISLPIGGTTILMGADMLEACGAPALVQGNNFTISINTESEEECRNIFNGLSAGGHVVMPLEKAFWGALFGMFIDKFGIAWMISFDDRPM